MGRPRLHPRRLYRAVESGVYFDEESGDELMYFRHITVLPDKDIETIPISRQEKLAKKLVGFGVFEPMDDFPQEIERVSSAPISVKGVNDGEE